MVVLLEILFCCVHLTAMINFLRANRRGEWALYMLLLIVYVKIDDVSAVFIGLILLILLAESFRPFYDERSRKQKRKLF